MPKDRKTVAGKSPSESATKKPSAKDKAEAKTPAKKAAPKKSATAKSTAKKSAVKKAAPVKAAAKKKSAAPVAKPSAAKKAPAKPRKSAKKSAEVPPVKVPLQSAEIIDVIGDVSGGEALLPLGPDEESGTSAAMMEAYRADTATEAEAQEVHEAVSVEEKAAEPHPEPQLERLQKILSQAGIASRRHAEEMIVAGRVIVNGQVITQLGAKADPDHDHIRVDGKLIQRAERHRTFVLNKPKGYVTTVSDPEGRPTVMDFFSKLRERLYPVGRLDFQSEGLLLMTNDGELANLLTHASSGVEKTYLVKVAGQLSPDQLSRVCEGVSIEKAEQGSHRVRTAPAAVRQIRPGDNPWYEVVLIEGRNREIRKMFSTTGHYVEKIRRVGYGPLILDLEPGHFREVTPEELNALRLTAEGKMKPRRLKIAAMLPKEAGMPAEPRSDFRGKQHRAERPRSNDRPPREGRAFGQRGDRGKDAGRKDFGGRFEKKPFNRGGRPIEHRERPGSDREQRPSFDRERSQAGLGGKLERGPRFGSRPTPRRGFGGSRPPFQKSAPFDRPATGRRDDSRGAARPPVGRRDEPRREFRPRPEGSEGFARPSQFSKPRLDIQPDTGFDRQEGSDRQRRSIGPRQGSAPRFDSRGKKPRWEPRPGAAGRPAGPGRPSGPGRHSFGARPSGPGRPSGSRPSFGARPADRNAKPGGFRKPAFRGKPGGGPPRRDRG